MAQGLMVYKTTSPILPSLISTRMLADRKAMLVQSVFSFYRKGNWGSQHCLVSRLQVGKLRPTTCFFNKVLLAYSRVLSVTYCCAAPLRQQTWVAVSTETVCPTMPQVFPTGCFSEKAEGVQLGFSLALFLPTHCRTAMEGRTVSCRVGEAGPGAVSTVWRITLCLQTCLVWYRGKTVMSNRTFLVLDSQNRGRRDRETRR